MFQMHLQYGPLVGACLIAKAEPVPMIQQVASRYLPDLVNNTPFCRLQDHSAAISNRTDNLTYH